MTLAWTSLALWSLLPNPILSSALNALQSSDGRLVIREPQNSIFRDLLLLNPNTSTLLAAGKIDCSESRFGHPPAESCREAGMKILRDPTAMRVRHTWGPRNTAGIDSPMPKRWISSDGQCVIDLAQTSFPSHVRDLDLFAAATVIQTECVEKDTPPWGGIAEDMGEEENLRLIVRSYNPPFTRCADTPAAARPDTEACQGILDTMKASTAQTRFGAVGVPGVQEHLPQVLTEPTGTCSIIIDTTVPAVQGSWYELWEAAVALDGMCARNGRTGKSRFLGANRKLVMEIKRTA